MARSNISVLIEVASTGQRHYKLTSYRTRLTLHLSSLSVRVSSDSASWNQQNMETQNVSSNASVPAQSIRGHVESRPQADSGCVVVQSVRRCSGQGTCCLSDFQVTKATDLHTDVELVFAKSRYIFWQSGIYSCVITWRSSEVCTIIMYIVVAGRCGGLYENNPRYWPPTKPLRRSVCLRSGIGAGSYPLWSLSLAWYTPLAILWVLNLVRDAHKRYGC